MKQTHLPVKMEEDQSKALLKKLSLREARTKQKKQGFKQLKIVQSVSAGRVRGGHSFH